MEVDSQVLVKLIHLGRVSKWTLCNNPRQIQHLLVSLSSSVSHIFWEANSCSDRLANLRLASNLFCMSPQQLPSMVRAYVLFDSRELSSVRQHYVIE